MEPTLVGVLRQQARSQGTRPAVTFLDSGEGDGETWTYGQLETQALSLAAGLEGHLQRGDRALLLYPPGLPFVRAFLGCLAAGIVAVPAYPPRRPGDSTTVERLLRETGARAVLTTETLARRWGRPGIGAASSGEGPTWLATDAWAAAFPRDWQPPALDPDSLAFLQYTSGSTADPRGVEIRHANLMANEEQIRQAFRLDTASVVVGWLPLYHDMGLIGNLLQPLYSGGRSVLMAPMAFLQRPARWLEAFSRFRGTAGGGPNFGYELCRRKIQPAEAAALDLSSWTVAFCGSEPIREETLRGFTERFRPAGFRGSAFLACYGLAEGTLLAAGTLAHRQPPVSWVEAGGLEQRRVVRAQKPGIGIRAVVSCGVSAVGQRLAVVDPEGSQELPPAALGEIWIAGPNVAKGYWRRPELSAAVFRNYLEDGSGPFLRTGDLGFLLDGELHVTGRLKDLIIVRGRNHYPQDLELTAQAAHPALRLDGTAAFAVDPSDDPTGDPAEGEALVLVQEIERRREGEAKEAADAIVQEVRRVHEVPVHRAVIIRAGTLPRTTSGKVRRRECRRQLLAGELTVLAEAGLAQKAGSAQAGPVQHASVQADSVQPDESEIVTPSTGTASGSLERELRQALGTLLGMAPDSLPRQRPLPLDSLAAVELSHLLEKRWGLSLPLSRLLGDPESGGGLSLGDLLEEIRLAPGLAGDDPSADLIPPSATGPMSYNQRSLWLVSSLEGDGGSYHVNVAARVLAMPAPERLRQAFQLLVERHPGLRTRFQSQDGLHLQQLSGPEPVDFQALNLDASGLNGWQREGPAGDQAIQTLRRQAFAAFDLAQGPLLRARLLTAGAETYFLLSAHHIVLDLWSQALLLDDLGNLLQALEEDREPTAPAAAWSPVQHALWQEKRLAGGRRRELEDFWLEALDGAPTAIRLPRDRDRLRHRGGRHERHPEEQPLTEGGAIAVHLPAALGRTTKSTAEQRGTTPFTLLAMAFGALLHRVSGQADLVFGSPTAGRLKPQLASTVGYLANPVPLRSRLSPAMTGEDLGRQMQATVLAALDHQELPFPALVERLAPSRQAGDSPFFQVVFAYEKPPRSRPGAAPFVLGSAGGVLDLGPLRLESVDLGPKGIPFELVLILTPDGDGFSGVLQYRAASFDATTAQRLARRYGRLLAGVLEQPERPVLDLPLLSPGESHQLRTEWNDTGYAGETGSLGRTETTADALVVAQARQRPDAIAVEDWQGRRLTYGELDSLARRLAVQLQRAGAGADTLVGLCAGRSLEQIVALNAILQAGAAYLPLDPAAPPARWRKLLQGTGCRLVLCAPEQLEALATASPQARVLPLPAVEDLGRRPAAPRPRAHGAGPAHLAYVVSTSGSTGEPKRIAIPHRGVIRLVLEPGYVDLGPADRVLAIAPLSFDASTFEIWGALANGACLHLFPPEPPSVARLEEVLQQAAITTAWLPTGLFHLLVERRPAALRGLRQVVTGGEVLSPAAAETARQIMKGSRLLNAYGPTENTTFTTTQRLTTAQPAAVAVPIGRPIKATQVYILDETSRLCALEAWGELFIGGDGLARGYFGQPAETAAAFLPNPFGPAGSRLYRSGDRARRLADGRLDFGGRQDRQVKIRGFRLEPAEIEGLLGRCAGVAAAVVRPYQDPGGGLELAAYVVPAEPVSTPAAAAQLTARLRQDLARVLPESLLPSRILCLEALPLTARGKVDRAALPEPPRGEAGALAAQVEASSQANPGELEGKILEIWGRRLDRGSIGLDDNFFEIGGHSLALAQVAEDLEKQLHLRLPMVELFSHPTVRSLARFLQDEDGDEAAPVDEVRQRAQGRRQAMGRRRRQRQAILATGEGSEDHD